MSTTSKVQTLIERGLPGAIALVNDQRGTGNHIKPLVIAAQFEDSGLVEQHREVYGGTNQHTNRAIPALGLQTLSPGQWEQAEKEGGQAWIWQPK